MVQVLPEAPSFAQSFARSIGMGLGSGISQASQLAGQSMLEKQKMAQRQKLIQSIEDGSPISTPGDFSNKIGNFINELENQLGKSFTDQEKNTIVQNLIGSPEMKTEEDPFLKSKKYAAVGEHDLASIAAKEAETEIKSAQKEREYHTDRAFKFLDEIGKKEESFAEREAALNAAFSAVESGEMSPWGGDFWADLLDIPQLRSVSGAQLQAAAKANLIGTIEKVTGTRMNQFMEKQVNDAFPKSGETPESQKAKLLIIKSVLDMEKNQVASAYEISSEQRKKYGYPRENIREETAKKVKSANEKTIKNLSYDLRKNMETGMGLSEMSKLKKVPKGTPLTYEMKEVLMDKVGQDADKALKLAIGLGYEIPEDTSMWER